MSIALYGAGGLRFWSEDEIELREAFQARAVAVVARALRRTNPAWTILRCEGPILTPASAMSASYDAEDVFSTDWSKGGEPYGLRAETTASSYAYARHLLPHHAKLPLCVWQAGKSFRKEANDGASAAKLRFNEFWQLEFQAIYPVGTKADYRDAVMPALAAEIARFTRCPTRLEPSDRVPAYAESTLDIEAKTAGGWREMASCSIRTDYPGALVAEFAIGLDRVATLAGEKP